MKENSEQFTEIALGLYRRYTGDGSILCAYRIGGKSWHAVIEFEQRKSPWLVPGTFNGRKDAIEAAEKYYKEKNNDKVQ